MGKVDIDTKGARITVEGFDVIASSFDKAIKKVITEKTFLEIVGEQARKYIVGKTRSRSDLSKEGAKQAELADSSIKARKYLEKYNVTDPSYSNKRSNLTFTGQLLDSVRVSVSDNKIVLQPDGDRAPYKTKNGISKSRPSNLQLAKYLEDKGRVFMAIDAKGQEILNQFIIRQVRRVLNTISKVKF